ncbi:unnamed protein product [Urochloa decumbens]|uniref:F-box domain-containing protein n=1 Tax=Urochloa decumbens TaxID=240449 RepID=A0ABC8YG36_9POAL
MERRQESERRGREIPIEILRDILVRLPTEDVVRSSCVSKLWRRIVGDPSFRELHHADHVAAPSESEALLVSEYRVPGRRDEVSFFNLSSGKAMCHVAIPSSYSLMNVCNGFICFALDYDQAPAVVCNPVTGETLELPEAPLIISEEEDRIDLSHLFVLGFSPHTREYKMFRLSSPSYIPYTDTNHKIYIAVYTLGGKGGWRQCSYLSQFCTSNRLPLPVHIDGHLYVPLETRLSGERTAGMLVLDVATETHRMYRLPYDYCHDGYHESWEMLADGFELNGQMCLAVNVLRPRRNVQFWVMTPTDELEDKDDDKLFWDLRYCLDRGNDSFKFGTPRAAWLDNDQMLCYRHAEVLYKHDTRGYSSSSNDGTLSFDKKVELPRAPYPSSSRYSSPTYRWNIYGGYRPSLLSPLTFAVPPSQGDKGKKRQFEHTLLGAITQSKRCIMGPAGRSAPR